MTQPNPSTGSLWQTAVDLARTLLTFLGPGRRAGFHVDAIIAYARRLVALLNETPPDLRFAAHQARRVMFGLSVDTLTLSLGIGSGSAVPAIRRSDVLPATKVVMQRAFDLSSPTNDLPAARKAAELLLNATQELKARADAFERSRDTH